MTEIAWFPAAIWQQDDRGGFPAIICYPELPASLDWDYMAFLGHFVTGLQDVYEHTFDSWDRSDNESGTELLVSYYRVEAAAKRLQVDIHTADQWLAYRSLHTQLPYPLVEFLSIEAIECAAKLPTLPPTQPDMAGMVCPFHWIDNGITIENSMWHPGQNSRVSNFLDVALTWNEIPWQTLFRADGEMRLVLRPEGLAELRSALLSDDVSRRIGTLPEGAFSDRALALILQARIRNLVAPAPLWEAILTGTTSTSAESDWQLPLPTLTMPDYENAA